MRAVLRRYGFGTEAVPADVGDAAPLDRDGVVVHLADVPEVVLEARGVIDDGEVRVPVVVGLSERPDTRGDRVGRHRYLDPFEVAEASEVLDAGDGLGRIARLGVVGRDAEVALGIARGDRADRAAFDQLARDLLGVFQLLRIPRDLEVERALWTVGAPAGGRGVAGREGERIDGLVARRGRSRRRYRARRSDDQRDKGVPRHLRREYVRGTSSGHRPFYTPSRWSSPTPRCAINDLTRRNSFI